MIRKFGLLALVVGTCLAACGSRSGAAAGSAESPAGGQVDRGLTMRVARAAHSAIELRDGRILLIGGCVRESCEAGPDSRTVDAFDPRTGRFGRVGDLLQPRVSTTAALLPSGKILLAGGWVGSTVSDSTELFDAAAGRSIAGPNLSSPRADVAMATLRDGRIVLAGGYDGRQAVDAIDLFNPADNSIRRIGALAAARAGAGAALLPDGRVLVVGGGTNGRARLTAGASAEIVDPATGRSVLTGSLSHARYKHAVARLPNGTVVAVGGSDERDSRGKLDAVERYDPSTGRFTIVGRTRAKRYKIGASVVVLPDGRVLIAGGAPQAEIFDPATGRVADYGPSLGGSLNFATATPVAGRGVLLAGGYYEDGIRLSRRAWLLR